MNINNGILEDILLILNKRNLMNLLLTNNDNINNICKTKSFRDIYKNTVQIDCNCCKSIYDCTPVKKDICTKITKSCSVPICQPINIYTTTKSCLPNKKSINKCTFNKSCSIDSDSDSD